MRPPPWRSVWGPERVYFADPAEYALAGISSRLREELEHKELDWPERILEDCARLEIRVLTMQDAEYPERLRQIDAPPAVLYVKGRTIPFDELVSVGVVGSRRPTPYGIQMAGDLGRDLAYRGAVVVSGIAQGIDSAALRGPSWREARCAPYWAAASMWCIPPAAPISSG